MDLQDVVVRRRMVRRWMVRRYAAHRPLPPEVVDAIVDDARRGQSAGLSHGFGFLVVDRPDDIARLRSAATPDRSAA